MKQLTVKTIKEAIKDLPDDTIVYLGDDEELNSIHQAFFVHPITDEEVDVYSLGSLTGDGGLLIS